MTRTVDDYDYDSIRDADYDDYDAEIYRWQASGWEPYGGEIDDGGNYFTELRRPKWVGRLIERVAASERGRWASIIENDHLWPAEWAGKMEIAEALTQIVNKLRAEDLEGNP